MHSRWVTNIMKNIAGTNDFIWRWRWQNSYWWINKDFVRNLRFRIIFDHVCGQINVFKIFAKRNFFLYDCYDMRFEFSYNTTLNNYIPNNFWLRLIRPIFEINRNFFLYDSYGINSKYSYDATFHQLFHNSPELFEKWNLSHLFLYQHLKASFADTIWYPK